MRVVVIGGTGLIGSKLVQRVAAAGHEAVAASPQSGVNTVTGEGLADVLAGADVVVDVSNAPSFADADVLEFFQASGRNLLSAEKTAGVGHHVAVSIVGADRLPESGYLRAKIAQENLIKSSGVPYTILRSTQFFEFLAGIVASATEGDEVRLPSGPMQPVAAEDVADALADLTLAAPLNDTVELGGPQAYPLAELGARYVANKGLECKVVADPHARYFGTELTDSSLLTGPGARLGRVTLDEWLATPAAQR